MTTLKTAFFEKLLVMDLMDRLKKFREDNFRTQEELAAKLGVSRSTYKNYERDTTPPARILRRLAELGFRGDEVGAPVILTGLFSVSIPYIGRVNASSTLTWDTPLASEEKIEVPAEWAGEGRFGCEVASDSCASLLLPGDTAVFQSDSLKRPNRMVLFRDSDNRITIKQLKHDGTDFYLHPLNPNYEDCKVQGEIIGFLIGILRDNGGDIETRFNAKGIIPK